MSLIVGFDDIKETIAYAIESRKRIHFLLEGPPACAKSLVLDAVRNTVPDAYMAFGSRTSGRGLSDALFEKKPSILLMDEADKMRHDVFSLTLGLMEAGEIIETKSGDTRGIKLNTMVIAACNSSKKMPPEFLSRFAFHPKFPHYTREEFVDVVRSMLSRVEDCPNELSEMIGRQIFDNRLGDVRQARGVWQLMREPTEKEAVRVLRMKAKYSPAAPLTSSRAMATQLL
jgi:MoxR-like ATPase